MNQITMGLLFLQLLNYTDRIQAGRTSFEQEILMQVYQYVEEHYKDGELTSLAARLHCDLTWLSRAIRRLSGCTYTEAGSKKAAEPGLLSPSVPPLCPCWISAWLWGMKISAISTGFLSRPLARLPDNTGWR